MSRDLLVCCGSLTIDNVVTADRRFLPQTMGGNVVYSALGALVWHGQVGVVSRAGEGISKSFMADLGRKGLDLSGVASLPEPHGMNVAFCYDRSGNRVRQFPPDVIAMLPPGEHKRFTDYTTHGLEHRFEVWTRFAPDGADIPSEWLGRVSGVHCAAMPVERHLSIGSTLRTSAARDAWLQVDSPWYDERDLSLDFTRSLFTLIDGLLPSEDDIRKVAGDEDPLATAARLVAAGAHTLVLKRGDAGADIICSGVPGRYRQPAYPCSVSDLTGAGDAFCGGFLAGMHRTGDPLRAAAYGTVSASFAVQAPGIAGLMAAGREEAERRLAELKSSFKSYAAG